MGVLARNYEKIYFRENVVVTKNLPTIFPNKSGAHKKKKKTVFRPSKKKNVVENSKSAHSPGQPLFQALHGILESLIAAFSRKHHTCTVWGYQQILFFFLDFSMVNHQHQSQGITGKPIPFFFFLASFFLQRLKNCFLPVFFDILVLIQSILDQFSKITIFSMEFEMCFSNVFSLAPEINDFFRCLRLWNFSTGGNATEWSTFLKTGPPKRTLYIYRL